LAGSAKLASLVIQKPGKGATLAFQKRAANCVCISRSAMSGDNIVLELDLREVRQIQKWLAANFGEDTI
jgi:hypothetical protein